MARVPKWQLGDQPVEAQHGEILNALAKGIDAAINGGATGNKQRNGFVLLVFPLGTKPGRCNYVSNAVRTDVRALLQDQLDHFDELERASASEELA